LKEEVSADEGFRCESRAVAGSERALWASFRLGVRRLHAISLGDTRLPAGKDVAERIQVNWGQAILVVWPLARGRTGLDRGEGGIGHGAGGCGIEQSEWWRDVAGRPARSPECRREVAVFGRSIFFRFRSDARGFRPGGQAALRSSSAGDVIGARGGARPSSGGRAFLRTPMTAGDSRGRKGRRAGRAPLDDRQDGSCPGRC